MCEARRILIERSLLPKSVHSSSIYVLLILISSCWLISQIFIRTLRIHWTQLLSMIYKTLWAFSISISYQYQGSSLILHSLILAELVYPLSLEITNVIMLSCYWWFSICKWFVSLLNYILKLSLSLRISVLWWRASCIGHFPLIKVIEMPGFLNFISWFFSLNLSLSYDPFKKLKKLFELFHVAQLLTNAVLMNF